jgi:hypothetical protein
MTDDVKRKNEEDDESEETYVLTPKGFFMALLRELGASIEDAEDRWFALEGFCMRNLDVDESYAALIFDGAGGSVLGVEEIGCELEDDEEQAD